MLGPSEGPNPGLALFLGLIPGVGAIYNGQIVKAMVQVLIFGSLIATDIPFHKLREPHRRDRPLDIAPGLCLREGISGSSDLKREVHRDEVEAFEFLAEQGTKLRLVRRIRHG